MKLIVATDKNWGIGKDGGLLCHLPGDLAFFKSQTQGKTVAMGRKTLESLPGGRPLPKRRNIVLTRDDSWKKEGCEVVRSIEDIVAMDSDELMIIGGGTVYEQFLPYCESCLVTRIDAEFDADTFFPNLDENPDFELVWESEPQEENGIKYHFTEYKRIAK